jgi:type IV pilus assembly protein PilE
MERDMVKMKTNNIQKGFTLIELLISIAIVAIIAAIAYPSYQDSIQSARRADAQANLVDLTTVLERYYTVTRSFVGSAIPTSYDNDFYQFTLSPTPTSTTYTIRATPIGPQASDRCGTMTITNTGLKTPVSNCW